MKKNKAVKRNKGLMAGIVCFVILLAAVLFFAVQLWRLNMLPAKIFIPVVLLTVLITALISIYLLEKPDGKYTKKKSVSRYVAMAAAVIVIAGCLFGGMAITKVLKTMSVVTDTPQISAIVDVRTRKDDPAEKLEDARDYAFGITDSYDVEDTQKTLKLMEKTFGKAPEVKSFESVTDMIDGLYDGEVDAIILNSSYMGILEHTEEYADAADRTKVIHEFSMEAKPEKPDAEKNPDGIFQGFKPGNKKATETPFLLYLSGSDSRSNQIAERSNTDVNIIAAVNPVTKEILLLNTPRDYFIPNPAGGGAKDKLTHCGTYGIDCSMEALGDLYDENIDYYARINFSGFQTLIDALGGVTVNSDVSFTRGNTVIHTGENRLNGTDALVFARERYLVPGGDNDRGKNQMKVVQAVIDKLTSSTLLTNYNQILDSMEGMFLTDVPADFISEMVKMQLDDMAQWNVHSYAVTGTGNSRITYSIPGTHVYVMDPDEDMVNHAQELVNKVVGGQHLTDADMQLPGNEGNE